MTSPLTYIAVPNSTHTLTEDSFNLPMQGCSNVTLDVSQHFQVLENDIVAACVLNSGGAIYPLFVTSTSKLDAIQVNHGGNRMCTDDELNQIDLSRLDHRVRNALHVHAIMGKLHVLVDHACPLI